MADVSYLLRSWGPPTGGEGGDVGAATGTHASLATGFPARDELIARYEPASGRPVDDLAFWIAFHCWRSAAITEGVYRRYIDGAMANTDEDADRYRQIVDALVDLRDGRRRPRLTPPDHRPPVSRCVSGRPVTAGAVGGAAADGEEPLGRLVPRRQRPGPAPVRPGPSASAAARRWPRR